MQSSTSSAQRVQRIKYQLLSTVMYQVQSIEQLNKTLCMCLETNAPPVQVNT